MNRTKSKIISQIIKREGGFVDDPDDSGGATDYGITEAVARDYGYRGPMRSLPRALAFEIYAARYWDSVRADEIAGLSESVAVEVVDTAVNMGVTRAVIFLQRSLNAFNLGGEAYADLKVDGLSGPATLSALRAYLSIRDESETLLKALNCLQGAFYIELAERREKDERFVYGWLKNRIELKGG